MSDEQGSEGSRDGGPDLVSLLYIVGGIPAMVGFFIGLFVLVHLFDIPA
jgi:hypothetical protein